MNPKHEILFTPMKIGSVEIPNRIIMCPMEGTSIVEWLYRCKFEKEHHDFFIERAKDGVGLYIPGMTPVRSMVGDKWLHKHPEVFKGVRELMDEMHSYGTKVFFQLGAGWGRCTTLNPGMAKLIDNKFLGKLMKPVINLDHMLVTADEGIQNVWMPQYKCHGLSESEIAEYVNAYAKCAKLCKDNGVDGVEVHAVHEGYILDQFATKYTNHRTDKYGGSLENRLRFAVEVVQAIKAECGTDYPVSLRYSVESKVIDFNVGAVPGEEYTEIGRDMAESEQAIQILRAAGYDAFNCDNGTYDSWYWAHPPVYMPLNCNLEDVKHIKKFTDAPVFCAGKMQMDAAAEAISAGELDGVGIGRQFLTDEKLLTKVKAGKPEEIRPCISCHISCCPAAVWKDSGAVADIKGIFSGKKQPGTCSLNPHTFHEKKYVIQKAKTPKRISVIGGGIGGMEMAIQASLRGHTVDLYEKTDRLGGTFLAAAAPMCKEKDRDLLDWYTLQMSKVPVKVHYNTEIKNLDEIQADEIVIATGGTPKKLHIPGAEKCIDVISALLNEDQLGDRVAIIGGGLAGCELAYDLVCKGKHPFIVEMQKDVIIDVNVAAMNSMMMRDLLRYHKVPLYLECATKAITDDGVVIEGKDGCQTIQADSFVSAVGFSSGSPLFDKKNKHVHIIGDAAHVSNLKGAIWPANDLAILFSK